MSAGNGLLHISNSQLRAINQGVDAAYSQAVTLDLDNIHTTLNNTRIDVQADNSFAIDMTLRGTSRLIGSTNQLYACTKDGVARGVQTADKAQMTLSKSTIKSSASKSGAAQD